MLSYRITLRTAVVSVRPDGAVETAFREDGSVAIAAIEEGGPDNAAAAHHAGYGGDRYRMLVEHEIGHSYVADAMGWPHSWSVWSAAHGTGDIRPMEEWSPRVRDEEHLVVALQRYVNTGVEDEYGKLREAFGPALPEVARGFVAVARPWLGLRPRPGHAVELLAGAEGD